MSKSNRSKPKHIPARKLTFTKSKRESYLQLAHDHELIHFKNVCKGELLLTLKMYLKLHGKSSFDLNKIDLKQLTLKTHNEVTAITDLDKYFYTCIDGQPIKVPCFSNFKLAVSKLIRFRQDIAFKNDAVLNIDTTHFKELEMYKKTITECLEQEKYFDCFISQDYQRSISFLSKCNQLNNKLDEKIKELYYFANEQFTIKSRLMTLDYLYKIQQKYGRFLYYLSPPAWRSKNREFAQSVEIEAKGFDLGNISEDDTFNTVYVKMKNECISQMIKPVLFFTLPEELIDIFERSQKQQLHHLAYVTHLAPLKNKIKDGIKSLKDMFLQETAFVNDTIGSLKKSLELNEERCSHLRSRFFKVLNGMFYANVASCEVLKFRINLEFCYERLYAEKPVNMNIISIAKCLEESYMNYTNKIDEQSDTVKSSVTRYIHLERRQLRKANDAAREIRLIDRLDKQLQRSFQLPANRQKFVPSPAPLRDTSKCLKQSYRWCTPTNAKKVNLLSDSEIEFLTLFTDWTEGDDPFKYILKKNSCKSCEAGDSDSQ